MIKKLHELKKILNFDLINFAVPIINFFCPIHYSPNNKYDNKYLFICLVDFLQTSSSWNKYRGTKEYPINGKYLNQIHNKYVKNGIYDEIEKQLLNKYLKTNRESKLKYQTIDSSFIQNKQGSVKNNDHLLSIKEKNDNEKIRKYNKKVPKNKRKKKRTFIGYNRYNGRKKYFKISIITDSYGVPLQKSIASCKESDVSTVHKNVDNLPKNINTLVNSKHNRYKQYFLADSGYHSKRNLFFLRKRGTFQ